MSIKQSRAAIADLLDKMKAATSAGELKTLADKARAWVTFAQVDEKMSRMTRAEGDDICGRIDAVQSQRLDELNPA